MGSLEQNLPTGIVNSERSHAVPLLPVTYLQSAHQGSKLNLVNFSEGSHANSCTLSGCVCICGASGN